MNQKNIAVAAILLSAWFSWFFRYDLSGHGVVLDRWSGGLIVINKKTLNKTILSDVLTDKEKAEKWAKYPQVITPPPEAMPAPELPSSENQDRATTRKGMFDDLEAEMSGGKQKEKGQ